MFIEMIVKLLNFPSISQNNDLIFYILFVFLVLIMGIIQVVFPNMIDVTTGKMDFSCFHNLDFITLIDTMGRNVVNQQFTFIYYIINKYLTFPIFSILNIGGMIMWAISFVFSKNSLDYNLDQRFGTMNFYKQLAYTAHMFVIGLIFAVVAPITNIIIFVTYVMMVAIDRYTILYMYVPDVTSDLSN